MNHRNKAITAARQFVNMKKATTACVSCRRVSKRRVGETQERRPLDWYPIDGSERQVTRMVARGASIEAITDEMSRCLALCRSCARKSTL